MNIYCDKIWAFTGPAGLEAKPKEQIKCPFLASQITPDQKDKEVEGMRTSILTRVILKPPFLV